MDFYLIENLRSLADKSLSMTIQELDSIFPFFLFFYGVTMTLVLHSDSLTKLLRERFSPPLAQQMMRHRGLALFCLIIGGLWSLQNLAL